MSPGFASANWLQALLVIALVGAAYVPLGDYMARVYSRSNLSLIHISEPTRPY